MRYNDDEIVKEGSNAIVTDDGINKGSKRKRILQKYFVQGNTFSPVADIKEEEKLIPAMYKIRMTMQGPVFEIHNLKTDELLRFKDSRYNEVLSEIDDFWERKDQFKALGFTHKRGVLLYGDPGTGKSCLIKLVIETIIKKGDVVFIADKSAHGIVEGLKVIREIEPDRRCLIVAEDIDEIIRYDEHSILELLDGDSQLDHILFLTTTNYLDRLPERMLRPGRLDRKLEVYDPPKEGRLAYLTHKLLSHEKKEEIERLADYTDGFSFAQLKEFVVGVYCLGQEKEKVKDRIINNLEESLLSADITEEELDKKLFESGIPSGVKLNRLLNQIM